MDTRLNRYFCLFFLFLCSFASHTNIFSMTDDEVASAKSFALNKDELDTLSIEDWIERTDIYNDFTFIANEFIQQMINTFKSNQWLCTVNRQTTPPQYTQEFAFLTKLVVPSDTTTVVIGDIHAKIETVDGLLHSLLDNGLIDSYMHVQNNVRIVFLGDYTDRGGQSFKVLASAALLAIKNPGRVFLLKGNHEDYDINLAFNIVGEISQIEADVDKQNFLIALLKNFYNYLSPFMFLGYTTGTNIRYQCLVHGSLDLRYDYLPLIDFGYDNLLANGGLVFWQLHENDINPKFINVITMEQSTQAPKDAQKADQDSIIFQELRRQCDPSQEDFSLIRGFVWNDIDMINIQNIYVKKGERGPDSIIQEPLLVNSIVSYLSKKSNVDGLVHAHLHIDPKQCSPQEISMNERSSGCCFIEMGNSNDLINRNVMKNDEIHNFSNNFSIITLISGPIVASQTVNYANTFLSITMNNGVWEFEAVLS